MYVALGDSISIDDYAGGAGRGGASLLASNRDDDFPEWSGKDLRSQGMDGRVEMLASDGATTWTVLHDQVPRLQSSRHRPSVVTLTAGGNDVLSCFGDTRAALAAIRVATARIGAVLATRSSWTTADAVVVLGTVYEPSDGTADAARLGLPPWPDAVKVIAELNAALRLLAAEHGVGVAEIHERFLGHGLAVGNPAQGDPRPADRDLWYCNVIEPNAWGASGVRAAFWDALDGLGPVGR